MLTVPIPDVNVTILENKRKTVGSTLSLKCNVTTVMGISSRVEILWIRNGTIVNETNNGRIRIFRNDSTHTSILQFSYLSEDDESNYTCSATILDSNNSELIELSNFDSTLLCLLSTYVPVAKMCLVSYCIACYTRMIKKFKI